jgi:DNA-binding transcriptional regulator YiaG
MTSGEFRRIRTYLTMSPDALALQLNVERNAIAQWESGRERVPDFVALLMNLLQRQRRHRRRAS